MSASDFNRDVAIHVSIKALVYAMVSLCTVIVGGAWAISATNTHVAEVLTSMEKLDARQDVQIGKAIDATRANSARIDVIDSRASRIESDIQELRTQQRSAR